MNTIKLPLSIAISSYIVAVILYWVTSPYIAIAIPSLGLLISLWLNQRTKRRQAITASTQEPVLTQSTTPIAASTAPAAPAAVPPSSPAEAVPAIQDPELASALEYIGIIEDMVLLEGERNNLDDEIVQKTLALLSRLNRLIPDLVSLGDSSINHNIVRLIRKDLNSTINPFLRLSGEAKRQNRRLLLDGIKDVDSKLTFYTQTIEQKDLMELRTKAELMHQRYRLND